MEQCSHSAHMGQTVQTVGGRKDERDERDLETVERETSPGGKWTCISQLAFVSGRQGTMTSRVIFRGRVFNLIIASAVVMERSHYLCRG